ncbi:hypothetical protein FOL47_000991 [Perkinsus chesapeaki]|uniref:Uncharacterized protein n=1 Tax=Perkinsus chesapeaki TaxID=330153 RepID=A0A7J6MM58_PERCH|nr:hypothetical protein FOL47_000991 [Perkinsus chesapeaki]
MGSSEMAAENSRREANPVAARYITSYQEYFPFWRSLGNSHTVEGHNVPTVSQVLEKNSGSRLVQPPMKLKIDMRQFKILDDFRRATRERQAERILSAHTIPKKFPVTENDVSGHVDSRIKQHPLYATTSALVGKDRPMQHQLAERYFPMNNDFTNKFTDLRPRYCGLNTKPRPSRIHKDLDEFY